MMRIVFSFCLLLMTILAPWHVQARWNDAWSERRTLLIDTSAAGVEIGSPLSAVTVPVRLHSGNFDFLAAKADGSDLRVIAGDDKTPLKFRIESWDAANELAVVWVQLPQVAPKSAGQKVYLYYGNPNAAAEADTPVLDGSTVAAFWFRSGDERPADVSGKGHDALSALAVEKAGLLAASGRFEGAALALPASPGLALRAGGPLSVSLWLRAKNTTPRATLFKQGALELALDGGKLIAGGAGAQLSGGALQAERWHHVGVALGDGQATLYVDGNVVAQGPASVPASNDAPQVGSGFIGLIDEVRIDHTRRSDEWFKFAAYAQGMEDRLLRVVADEAAADAGHASYIGILVDNLTVDAWVVIVILSVMLLIAIWVMIDKGLMVSRIDKDNRAFLARFRATQPEQLLDIEAGDAHPRSTLFRLYQAGASEAKKRVMNQEGGLSGAMVDAIKAAVDADLVRENHRLNAKMVLLTIAISGGPFLGLLGTVIGVMITFAAIAAAGDVNVTAIAPGIAAALLATVAGLAVAIPSLFGYNYLASRIKNISADMQIFVDEFITRVAEQYGR